MATIAAHASFLVSGGTRLPTEDELTDDDIARGDALEGAELLARRLNRIEQEKEPIVHVSAEEAWHLSRYAAELEYDAEQLAQHAKVIRNGVGFLWHERMDRRAAA